MSENLSGLASLYRSQPFFENFQRLIARLYKKQLEKLGWDPLPGESSRTGTLRETVIRMMGIANDEKVTKEAYDRFMRYKENPEANPIAGDLRCAIFRLALRHDEAVVLRGLMEIYEKSTFPEEQRDCLSVMGKVKDIQRHSEVLEYAFHSGKVRFNCRV